MVAIKSSFAKASADKGELAQLARAPALHAGGQGFESLILHVFLCGRLKFESKFFKIGNVV